MDPPKIDDLERPSPWRTSQRELRVAHTMWHGACGSSALSGPAWAEAFNRGLRPG